MDDWTWALDPDALYPRRADGGGISSGPHLRPAVKIGDKVYAADLGGTHMDALKKAKSDLPPAEYGRAARDDNTRGYVTHKGGFLDRVKAFSFAQKNGLIDPKYQNWFGDYFTNGRSYELPSEVLMGYSDERSSGGGLPAYLVPHRAAGGRVTPVDDALAALKQPSRVDHPARIPQRIPTSKKHFGNPHDPIQMVDLDALRMTPDLMEHNINLVRAYPNVTKQQARYGTNRLTESFINHLTDNLLWLHDLYDPEVRGRSKMWYVGANKIANDWAKEHNLPVASVAGALAALSPQKDWFQNVSLAKRVIDIYHGMGPNFRAAYTADEKMMSRLEDIFPQAKHPEIHAMIAGRSLSEMRTPEHKAAWVRLYDEAHGDRAHQIVSPEGELGDVVRTAKGLPSGTGWGSLKEIGKAIAALESGGDQKILSGLMGKRHKVRNFYNNILDPHSMAGDVTIDTHAVAAALLRPLAGASLEVAHNFGNHPGVGLPAAGGSAITGVQGLYPIYSEAYRRAAKARGLLPREMQSITWEAVRGLFPEGFKTKKNVAAVDALWQKYRNGELDLDQTRNQVHALAGGITNPDWFRPDLGNAAGAEDPANAGELDQAGLHGITPEGLGGGARAGDAAGPTAAPPALTDYLVQSARAARGGRIRAMATRWSPRPTLMPDVNRDPLGDALAALKRRG
jgi:hypothetical protein